MSKKEIRFMVTEDAYNRLKMLADFYGEAVGPYARHLLLDQLSEVEFVDSQKVPSEILDVLRRITSGDFNKLKKLWEQSPDNPFRK